MLHKGNKKIGRYTNYLKESMHLEREVQEDLELYYEGFFDNDFDINQDYYNEKELFIAAPKAESYNYNSCYDETTYNTIVRTALGKAGHDVFNINLKNVEQSVYKSSEFLDWEERFKQCFPIELSLKEKWQLYDDIAIEYFQLIIDDLLLLNDIDFDVYNDDRFVNGKILEDEGIWSCGPPMKVGIDATIYKTNGYNGATEIDVATTPYSNRRALRVLLYNSGYTELTFDHYETFYELEFINGLIKLTPLTNEWR